MVLLLHLHAFFDSQFSITKRPILQLADQLGIKACLLGSDGIQVAYTIHVILRGSHVQRCMVVIVQAPYVGTKRHQEEKAVEVTIGSCQVERRVPPYVTLVWVSPEGHKKSVDTFKKQFIDYLDILIQNMSMPIQCHLYFYTFKSSKVDQSTSQVNEKEKKKDMR